MQGEGEAGPPRYPVFNLTSYGGADNVATHADSKRTKTDEQKTKATKEARRTKQQGQWR